MRRLSAGHATPRHRETASAAKTLDPRTIAITVGHSCHAPGWTQTCLAIETPAKNPHTAPHPTPTAVRGRGVKGSLFVLGSPMQGSIKVGDRGAPREDLGPGLFRCREPSQGPL